MLFTESVRNLQVLGHGDFRILCRPFLLFLPLSFLLSHDYLSVTWKLDAMDSGILNDEHFRTVTTVTSYFLLL